MKSRSMPRSRSNRRSRVRQDRITRTASNRPPRSTRAVRAPVRALSFITRRYSAVRSMSSRTSPRSSSSVRRRSAARSTQRPIDSMASCRPARAAVRGLLAWCTMTPGAVAPGLGASTCASARPASSSASRSLLRRSRPPGGGADGRDRTGATTQASPAPGAAIQSEPTGMGTCQRRSVVSRSNGGGTPAVDVARGTASRGPVTSHRVTGRPMTALACRRTSPASNFSSIKCPRALRKIKCGRGRTLEMWVAVRAVKR